MVKTPGEGGAGPGPVGADEGGSSGRAGSAGGPGSQESSHGGIGDAGPDRAPGSRLWPVLITIGLALVMLVNGIFIYIAVKGADDVVPSYLTEER